MRIEFLVFSLRFRATRDLHFEGWKAANLFRGVFGISLQKVSCPAACPGAASCEQRDTCAYARLFEPTSDAGPSGLKNRPRPFVIQSAPLNGLKVARGGEFVVSMHVFDSSDVSDSVTAAFRYLDMADLLECTWTEAKMEFRTEPCQQVTIDFLSPTELKWQDRVLRQPHFSALFARARDRVAMLTMDSAVWDFKRLGDLAAQVKMVACDVQPVEVERKSSRTGQRHGLGGFIGSATYEGELDELLPILQAAQYMGVGRHTAWGNGAIRVQMAARSANTD